MDWEKQDNELRRLMESTPFLPDNETWDAKKSWESLRQKKQLPKKKSAFIWLRWSAAACVIGLLGTGIWWMQQHKSDREEKEGIAQKSKVALPYSNEKAISIPVENQFPNNATTKKIESEGKILIVEAPLTNRKTPIRKQKSKQVVELNDFAPSKLANQNMASAYKKDPEKAPEKEGMVLPDNTPSESNPASQVFAVVPAPNKPNKVRVVHYNELVGSPSTSPPVFVQSKKQENQLESIVLQGSGNRKDPMFHLNFNISPTPKKSL